MKKIVLLSLLAAGVAAFAMFGGNWSGSHTGAASASSTPGTDVTYDINTTTNYNAGIEAVAPRPALRAVAAYLGRLLDDETRKAA